MTQLIKRGGFREQAARQLKYKNSVNQRADINAQVTYQPDNQASDTNQIALEPCNPLNEAATTAKKPATKAPTTPIAATTSEDSTHKNN